MGRDYEDPRDVKGLDFYEVVTSDEEEDTKIQDQLKELERQSKDLQERLRLKEERRKNLSQLVRTKVEIPASPRKKSTEPVLSTIKPRESTIIRHPRESDHNVAQKAPQSSNPANTTSYFLENFANVRKTEEQRVQHRDDLMNCRVHTFKGLKDSKPREPLLVDEKEQYTGCWITRRYVATAELDELFKDIKILRLPKLFGKVRPPKFSEPDYANWVATGIISFKSAVKLTSASKPAKYFKFTMTDFQHNLDVYVFGNKNVEKYYNLRSGDVIAILNPDILPWRPSTVSNDEFSGQVVKSFNLSIRHNYDCILEIGTSKHLAFCQIYNKSTGKVCGSPINKSSTDRCEYHQEVRFRQINAQRIELNGSTPLRSPTKNGKKQALYGNSTSKKKYALLPDKYAAQPQDRESQNTLYFSNPNYARAFFDDSYQNPDLLNNLENKRRKLRDTAKDKLLQTQIDKAVGQKNAEAFKNKTHHEQRSMQQATEQALASGLVKGIGFDPTKGRMKDVLVHHRGGRASTDPKSSQVKEIMGFKKSNVDLAPSRQEQKKRMLRREQVWREHFQQPKEGRSTALPYQDVSDSDSEIEII
ncbi:LAME_0F03994g1_1 [Lachancea meyersii CBS 8951]|uniref:LAME_0F03994g1_1 n=1 Tax=Lachancea meyersii CBS 8951 TaxID=1266667 RepID=A0A1G4JRP6_9SACH|nr:LAME_0F03994g1_1 [Lachancea meyersii CBS 8951]